MFMIVTLASYHPSPWTTRRETVL